MRAFSTHDCAADLRNAPRPIAVIVGARDQLFTAGEFAPAILAAVRGTL